MSVREQKSVRGAGEYHVSESGSVRKVECQGAEEC